MPLPLKLGSAIVSPGIDDATANLGALVKNTLPDVVPSKRGRQLTSEVEATQAAITLISILLDLLVTPLVVSIVMKGNLFQFQFHDGGHERSMAFDRGIHAVFIQATAHTCE